MKLALSFLFVAFLWSCAALTPPPDRTKCGPRGVSCGNGYCCDLGYSCIPSGLCQFTEENPEPAARRPVKQRPAQ